MNETWEETVNRIRKLIGKKPVEPATLPTPRYSEPIKEMPRRSLWEVRKITLPVDSEYPQGQVILYGVTKAEAEWWLENKLKTKSYHDDTTDFKTIVTYEKFPIDGTPKERNIYSNPERFCTEEFLELKLPRRVE